MIRIKDDSVCVGSTSIGLWIAITIAEQVYAEYGKELVWTSANDARHSVTSLHYNGDAGDFRIYDDVDMVSVRNEIKRRLNIDYDIILEGNHLHIEFQPRRR